MARELKKIYKKCKINQKTNQQIIHFRWITAVIKTEHKPVVQNIIKTKLRRNVLIKLTDIKIKRTNEELTILIIYLPGEAAEEVALQVIKSAGGRAANAKLEKIKEVKQKMEKTKKRLKIIIKRKRWIIKRASKELEEWRKSILKEQRLNEGLEMLKDEGRCMIGKGWVSTRNLTKLSRLCCADSQKGRFIFEVQKMGYSSSNSKVMPPTSLIYTPIGDAFQNLTNVFGVPKYNEINPAVFLMFTFPFLFGAMFGDLLHGLILLFISVLLIRNFASLNHRCGLFQIILEGRYVLLLSSLAAIWFGILYGDFGSLPFSLFNSEYNSMGQRSADGTYPFGIDPIWHHAENKMIFVNNLKMKLSLIIGFVHMGLGAFIALCNSSISGDKATLIFQAVPQFISFFLFLGYLVFLCFYKWLVTHSYPSIINTLISMYTDPFNIPEPMYNGQLYVQLFILSAMLVSIPWMFFGKPIYMIANGRVPETGMLDLWISSGIHLVEFCLGLISNSSSYLRLWAVSLAHVQLTSVLHQFTLGNTSWLGKIITFPVYLLATFILLIGLEGLSAALHALRLNWIEFFSKFYSGSGTLFVPYNFEKKDES